MKYLSADILFKDETAASQFFAATQPHLQDDAWTLNKSLTNAGASIPSDYSDFSIDAFRQFRNVVHIEFYCGTRDEYEEIIKAFFTTGAHMLKLRVRTDECDETERHVANQRVRNIKQFDQEYDSLVIVDVNLAFSRAIIKSDFVKAINLLEQMDLTSFHFDDEHLLALTNDDTAADLMLALIARGVFTENRLVNEDMRLFSLAAGMGSLAVVKAFFDLGFDPYLADANGSNVLHAVLSCNQAGAIAAAQYVAEQCAANLNPVGEEGSPLWLACYRQANMAGAKYFSQRGAIAIAPDGFYDGLAHADIIAEATSHGDLATLKTHFTVADYDLVLRKAIHGEALDIVLWVDGIQKIDWLRIVETDRFDERFAREVRLFETPFLFASGDNADLDFYDMIIDAVASHPSAIDVMAVYLAGYNGSSRLLRKLGALGAVFGPAPIEHGEAVYPLYKAALGGHLGNIATLLDMGAAVPVMERDSLDKFVLRNIEKNKAEQAKALFVEYGV
ncbi:hypothetical protein [Undibacterium sp. TJN19]|uniref:hypothetical protein n=1 Tax=Undibacterium sp. TJN19 TaxID=3413055 RepID=UPI003BF0F948